MPSVERMATCGWLMIGNWNNVPYCPGLVTVKVPPARSSGARDRLRARVATSTIERATSWMERSSTPRTTGATRPWKSRSTATARLTVPWTMSSSSPTEAFSRGNSARASHNAETMNGRWVRLVPSAARQASFSADRTMSTAV